MLIGLSGLKWNGKTTAGKYLSEKHGFVHTKFAAPLKDMLRTLLRHGECDEDIIERIIEGDLKEKPNAYLGNRTPVHAMQTLGTEWGRDLIVDGLWGNIWQSRAVKLMEDGCSVLVDDARFPNEAARIRSMGGYVALIKGRSTVQHGHVSEDLSWLTPDYTIINDGDMDRLHKQLDEMVEHFAKEIWYDQPVS